MESDTESPAGGTLDTPGIAARAGGPAGSSPAASEAAASGPAGSGAPASEAAASGPASSGPPASDPAGSGAAASGPAGSGPPASQAAASDPAASGPAASGPAASGPADSSPAGSGPPATAAPASAPAATAWEPLSDLDDLDRRIVHALQIDGRAAFSRIAEVLGVSDQTVARRYGRLRGSGVLRVLGLVDPLRIGVTPWFVRVRCAPDAAASVGEALARRKDTRWVSLISGGTEIFCLIQPERPGQDELLLQKLPRTPRVVQVAAHALVHVFFGQDLSPVSRNGPLGAAQVAALTPPDAPRRRVAEAAEPFPLGPADRRLMEALAEDGRTPVAELAAATGWSPSTVRRRLSELRAAGALYFDLAFDGDTHAKALRTALWLEVEPARLAEVGAALAEHEEVAFASATTGSSNVYAAVNCRNPAALYRYLTGPVARLPGIRRTETAPIHRMLKGPGPIYDPQRTRSPC